ncbi:MAG TPA: ABC transporter permease, partial [Pseudomonadales bacterium]|nr:ABC transporter permease [Pseudomonadales bacterium]
MLTIAGIAISVALLVAVEKIRVDAHTSFANTISGTDLVVGARSGSVQLLLYSVFRIGNATNNVGWDSFKKISAHPAVAWAIPIALGDSHRGFRVMGTTNAYFEHFHYGNRKPLEFDQGAPFEGIFDAVIGADVAKALGYTVGQKLVVAHGTTSAALEHANLPFHVVGILKRTGTPVDRTVHVTLAGFEAIHVGWESGTLITSQTLTPETALEHDLEPKTITAFFLGMKRRVDTFQIQRAINEFPDEPLLAVLPGVALQELWDLVGVGERALLVVGAMVVFSGLTGMLIGILSTLNERRREIAILRSVGARPAHIFALLVAESTLLGVGGTVLGVALIYLAMFALGPYLATQYGLD